MLITTISSVFSSSGRIGKYKILLFSYVIKECFEAVLFVAAYFSSCFNNS